MKALTRPELDLKTNERLVALVILSFADMQTLTSYPSINEIRRRAKVNRNTVSRAIKNLRKLGLMNVTKRRNAGGKFARNEYDFNPLRQHIYRVSTEVYGHRVSTHRRGETIYEDRYCK